MKFQKFLSALLISVIFCGSLSKILAQRSNYLSGNVTVSFNGTFQTILDKGFRKSSENGVYKVKYSIGTVSDETRKLTNLQLFENEKLLFTMNEVPGSDIYISNSGMIALIDMKFHFSQQITISFYDLFGRFILKQTYAYASLFGFSPGGNKFVVGTDKNLHIIDLISNSAASVERSSQFAFSKDETLLATTWEGDARVYENFKQVAWFCTRFVYPRGISISEDKQFIGVIDKKDLKVYDIGKMEVISQATLPENYSFRAIRQGEEDLFLAGVHYRCDGVSKGILNVYNPLAKLVEQAEIDQKNFKTIEKVNGYNKQGKLYDPIPWPFEPFNQVHKVWNHYEQHMGDGSGDWSYLHQGLDIEVPIGEPTYAVSDGFVKLVLTIGGDYYWRVAVSPEQEAGFSDGWLYAHFVPSSIQVDVGDTVQIHDYLGDIIDWAEDWGHIHFVEIHDHGTVWYYDDDEWGINFNPLLALDPITDEVSPQIENFSSGSKFGFCVNGTSTYLSSGNLHGDVDIIAKVSDYHGSSEWEQPAFKTYYWFNKLPENTNVFPKTLGQILNHSYSFYESGHYTPYALLIYKLDNAHPSPPWMNEQRDYWQILTNNNGDSIAELSEEELAFPTADYPDGDYRLFVEAWDEYGNMDIDSMTVTFDNFATQIFNTAPSPGFITSTCYPNPASNEIYLEFVLPEDYVNSVSISLFNSSMMQISCVEVSNPLPGSNKVLLKIRDIIPGLYFYQLDAGEIFSYGKLVIL